MFFLLLFFCSESRLPLALPARTATEYTPSEQLLILMNCPSQALLSLQFQQELELRTLNDLKSLLAKRISFWVRAQLLRSLSNSSSSSHLPEGINTCAVCGISYNVPAVGKAAAVPRIHSYSAGTLPCAYHTLAGAAKAGVRASAANSVLGEAPLFLPGSVAEVPAVRRQRGLTMRQCLFTHHNVVGVNGILAHVRGRKSRPLL